MTAAELKLIYKYSPYWTSVQAEERTNSRRSTFEKTRLTPPIPLLLLAQTKELDPLHGFHLGSAASSKPIRGSALHGHKFDGYIKFRIRARGTKLAAATVSHTTNQQPAGTVLFNNFEIREIRAKVRLSLLLKSWWRRRTYDLYSLMQGPPPPRYVGTIFHKPNVG